eukprot:m.246266 g.246266  ORF g.246266 m.246266 type:complete len:159 (-) comp15376_c0_seq2:1236-1712(-)
MATALRWGVGVGAGFFVFALSKPHARENQPNFTPQQIGTLCGTLGGLTTALICNPHIAVSMPITLLGASIGYGIEGIRDWRYKEMVRRYAGPEYVPTEPRSADKEPLVLPSWLPMQTAEMRCQHMQTDLELREWKDKVNTLQAEVDRLTALRGTVSDS